MVDARVARAIDKHTATETVEKFCAHSNHTYTDTPLAHEGSYNQYEEV